MTGTKIVLISRHNRFAMSCRSDEEDDAAPLQPSFTTPTKAIRNDGAGHGEQDAEGTNAESDSDVEKKFDESMGNLA